MSSLGKDCTCASPRYICIDYHARESPDRIFALVPKTQNVADGFCDVNMKTMATAVDYMAWWLDGHSKNLSKDEKVLAYIGVSDIRYPIIFFAAIKVGWTVRNSPYICMHLHVRLFSSGSQNLSWPSVIEANSRMACDRALS